MNLIFLALQGDGTGRRFHRDKNTGIEHGGKFYIASK